MQNYGNAYSCSESGRTQLNVQQKPYCVVRISIISLGAIHGRSTPFQQHLMSMSAHWGVIYIRKKEKPSPKILTKHTTHYPLPFWRKTYFMTLLRGLGPILQVCPNKRNVRASQRNILAYFSDYFLCLRCGDNNNCKTHIIYI